jgi:hypothetical protein
MATADQVRTYQLLPVVAVTLLMSACAHGASAAADPPTADPPAASAGILLGNKDNHRVVNVGSGQRVAVALSQNQGMTLWTHPATSDQSVLAPVVDPGATAARGMTLASFQAAGRGTATLSSSSGPSCAPGKPCPHYLLGWSVEIHVS